MSSNKKSNAMKSILSNAVIQKQENEDVIKQKITIREDFKSLIPPLTQEEQELLQKSILVEGCRDAIVLSKINNQYVIIDGHNRYNICKKNNLDFKIEIKEFKDIQDITDWMIANQLGKRNLSEEAKSYLRGKQYQHEKNNKQFKGNQHTNAITEENNKTKTSQKLAEVHKVSPKTIQRDEKYMQAVDKITGGNQSLAWKIFNKNIPLTKTQVLELSEKSEQEILEVRQKIENGEFQQEKKLNENTESKEKIMEKTNIKKAEEISLKTKEIFENFLKNPTKNSLQAVKQEIERLEGSIN